MFNYITSKSNARLKFARKVSSGKLKEFVFAEGFRLVKELLRSEAVSVEAFCSDSFFGRYEAFVDELRERGISISKVSDDVFDSIADTKSSQGVILICEKPSTGADIIALNSSSAKAQYPLVLFLHKINNPNNLGAIFRTAEAANISGVIVSESSTSAFSPKALRGSMGASLRIPVWENASFEKALNWGKESGLVATCADTNSKNNFWDVDWKMGRLLIFGSEANGLSAEEFARVEENIHIPMENGVESLNLAVSSALVMYEYKRQTN